MIDLEGCYLLHKQRVSLGLVIQSVICVMHTLISAQGGRGASSTGADVAEVPREQQSRVVRKKKGALKKASKLIDKWAAAKKDLVGSTKNGLTNVESH